MPARPFHSTHPDLLDKHGAAALLSISVRTLESKRWQKKLATIKLSKRTHRYRRSDIERLLDRKTEAPVEL